MTTGSTRGLLVDYGGVLTSSVARSFRAFERDEDLPKGIVFEVIAEAYSGHDGAIARFERGEISANEFAHGLAAEFDRRGHAVDADGIHLRLFKGVDDIPDFWDVVRTAHEAGVRTALLSNSWGRDGYPMDRINAHFDVVVISGEVGLRKPDPEIFHLTLDRLELEPEVCAFVDDLERNAQAATELGLHGIHHVDLDKTIAQLEDFLEIPLR